MKLMQGIDRKGQLATVAKRLVDITQNLTDDQAAPLAADVLGCYVAEDALDDVPVPARQPRPNSYAQYPLYVSPDLSIVSFVWGPGQTTPIHDHGTWGVVAVLVGTERSRRYRRVDDGRRPGFAELVASDETTDGPGALSVVHPPNDDIHLVANAHQGVTISLHVYGADIGARERHLYEPLTGRVRRFVSGYTLPWNPTTEEADS
jgi:predicted metal-dependent enzyme (double-stranded beta helix superfamily)